MDESKPTPGSVEDLLNVVTKCTFEIVRLEKENERLQRIVDAGERLYEAVLAVSNPAPQFHRETQEALLPALAVYEVATMADMKITD